MRLQWRSAFVIVSYSSSSSSSWFSTCYHTSVSRLHATNFLLLSLLNHNHAFHETNNSNPRPPLHQSKLLCTKTYNSNNADQKVESTVSKYEQQYRQLENLDFMTAAKMLFTDAPKKKKFGIDFHLVQLFFACMPSLAVYLVAQYARHEMRKMDAELEQKKKQEEDKAREMELNAVAVKEAEKELISEVKDRLNKLEETVKEIVIESKKQSDHRITKAQDDINEKKQPATSESGDIQSRSESSTSVEKEQLSKQNLNQEKDNKSAPVHSSSQQEQKGNTQTGVPSQDQSK